MAVSTWRRMLVAAGALCTSGGLCVAQPTIVELEGMPADVTVSVTDVSPDGSAVVGSYLPVPGGRRAAFRWTEARGLQVLGVLPGLEEAEANGVSDDGTIVIGSSRLYGGPGHAFRWIEGQGMEELPGLPGAAGSSARAISGDGSVIVGNSQLRDGGEFFSRAFIWTEAGGAQDLGLLPGTEIAQARAISWDGSTVVGSCGMPGGFRLSPFRWTAAEGMQELEVFPGSSNAGANSISADGTVAVGFCDLAGSLGRRAVRWTVGQGIHDLGLAEGRDDAYAQAVSDDGKVVLGLLHPTGGPPAGLWTDALGAVNLRSYLISAGVSMGGWTSLKSAVPSADGSVIAGQGWLSGSRERAYLVTGLDLPTCRADLDGDGELTFFDFLAFQNLFASGHPRADFDGDGELTFFDFLAFQTAFAAGCP